MTYPWYQKIRKKLFIKIFILFVTSLILTIGYLVISHRIFFFSRGFPKILRNSVNHVELLINEIGEPFNVKKARTISRKLEIQIRYRSPGFQWASNSSILKLKTENLHVYNGISRIKVGFTKKGPAINIIKKSGSYLFILHSERENFRYIATLFMLFFIIFISIVITGMYFIIKKILNPVKTLEQGVKQLRSGNIEYKIDQKSNDEFGELINSFNSMSSEIKKMIKARDQLLMDVSHELRSPLTRIKVALEFINDSEARQSIEDDISEIEKMAAELLETERLNSPYGSLRIKNFNLNNIVKGIIREMKNSTPGVKLKAVKKETFLKADPERVKILLKNIIGNAVKFSKDQDNPVEISINENERDITVKITDFGPGISENELSNIFEPFYRIDKSRSKNTGGYGLGLSLCKKIMDAHRGEISIKSSKGAGTTVYLKFKILK